MRDLKLGFADTFDTAKRFFTETLSQYYNVIRDDDAPDYLIFGDRNFGETHYTQVRISGLTTSHMIMQ
jgi:inorganic pyrophosphatase